MATLTSNLGLTKPELTDNLTPTIFQNNFDIIDAAVGKFVTGVLEIGQTSVGILDACIRTTSIVEVYTDVWGVSPTAIVCNTGSMTLTFDAQTEIVNVKAKVI